ELRGPEFVTRKITLGVAGIATGRASVLHLGNLDARRDWGYAPDYVEAMHRMLRHEDADDYVIATGRSASVRDFVDLAFAAVDRRVAWEGSGADEVGVDTRTGEVVVRIDP